MSFKDLFKHKKQEETQVILSDFLNSMTGGIRKISEKVASDIMIPRVDVSAVNVGMTLDDVVDVVKKDGYSRFPVWEEKLDNVVGILYVKDLFFQLNVQEENLVLKKDRHLSRTMVREAFFIPETKKIESLLKEFLKKKVHLAIVLDEYGGFSGIVTLEDIIELITGEIHDEYDNVEVEIKKISELVYEILSRTDLETIEETLGIDYSAYKEEIDTIGGLIYNKLERVPRLNEEIEIDHILYQIIRKEGNKILILRVTFPEKK
jgi:CBS domain containing-hemolysin-like protein